jgi:hypothetical protein
VTDISTSQQMHSLTSLDPCLAHPSFSIERFVLFAPIFLTMTLGSALLFIFLSDYPFGIQFAALVCYTSAVVLYTFSANRHLPRYLFRCPLVRGQIPCLARRHLVCLAVLFVLLTVAFQLPSHLSASWLIASGGQRSMPPLTIILFILSACLALVQILTNRSLLDRVHIQHNTP